MGWLYQLFFPAHTPSEDELQAGRHRIIAEGAVAGVIYAVATGNFLAGYLSSLGASVSLCAAAAMIPSFGCVLQFISPFVFERMHHRKLAIWLMCVVFRLSVSSILLIPLALPDPGHARAVELRYLAYCIPESFLHAGLVLCAPFLCTFGCAGSDCRCGGLCRRRITGKHKPAVCVKS